ncbi:hypothetical protein BI037_gp14 [Morganella phage vB_MmoP_MP2]|uniref:Uncharacterized protein n=1 Tax=Morganella phage vB_MmoP_MP2 TaxID=1852627 RepID=A0A192YA04_9CAUD|nr:hypothetical protein BI037_gp14 [Morganella phage vB_MmoP_MP2]ANM46387.1 hypothetical protein MP2_gp13A [Morganella phage vB_MmoP_MP2]
MSKRNAIICTVFIWLLIVAVCFAGAMWPHVVGTILIIVVGIFFITLMSAALYAILRY